MNIPEKLKPYVFHGLHLEDRNQKETIGDCPFCEDNKFFVNKLTGKYRCWKCGERGNAWEFIRSFHALCVDNTGAADYEAFAEDRQLLYPDTLTTFGVCKSITSGEWLVPGFSHELKIVSLYRYIKQGDGSRRLIPTPTLGHRMFCLQTWDPKKPVAYIFEGPWDPMAFYEVARTSKDSPSGMIATADEDASFFSECNVMGVPGCEAFFPQWCTLLADKVVNLMYDSDHPRKHPKTKHISPGPGWTAMERVTGMLSKSPKPPEEINCIHWGEDGYDKTRKSGFDVRDALLTL